MMGEATALARRFAAAPDIGDALGLCDGVDDRMLAMARLMLHAMYEGAQDARKQAEEHENKLLVFCVLIDERLKDRGWLDDEE